MSKWIWIGLTFGILMNGCTPVVTAEEEVEKVKFSEENSAYVVVLGVAQDAGFPQADCQKDCCANVWKDSNLREKVTCLGIVDPIGKTYWMIDATPDFKDQLQLLQDQTTDEYKFGGILLTHAHMGHYSGLLHLGREAMGADHIPVYCMPRMANYLKENGPWSQLVELGNIEIVPMEEDSAVAIGDQKWVSPFLVPHRDEFSETVGFRIIGVNLNLLFIPDIDKWDKWNVMHKDIAGEIEYSTHAFIDGTFYENGEIPGRDMSDIPHPFVAESMDRFQHMAQTDKAKIHFIHFNHTNPILQKGAAVDSIEKKGFHIAEEGMKIYF